MNKPLTDDTVSRYRTFVNALDVAGYLACLSRWPGGRVRHHGPFRNSLSSFLTVMLPWSLSHQRSGLARSHGA